MAKSKGFQADTGLTEVYINELLTPKDMEVGRRYVRAPFDVVLNRSGEIEFRVRKELWPKLDTQKLVLRRLTDRMGQPTSTGAHASTQAYVWSVGEGRLVTLKWIYGKGVFIKLTDWSQL